MAKTIIVSITITFKYPTRIWARAAFPCCFISVPWPVTSGKRICQKGKKKLCFFPAQLSDCEARNQYFAYCDNVPKTFKELSFQIEMGALVISVSAWLKTQNLRVWEMEKTQVFDLCNFFLIRIIHIVSNSCKCEIEKQHYQKNVDCHDVLQRETKWFFDLNNRPMKT